MQKIVQEKGALLGVALILPIIAAQFLAYSIEREDITFKFVNSIFIFYVGSLFLCSFYFAHKTFLFRWLSWFCINFSWPKSRKMAFFYFWLCMFLGLLALGDAVGGFN